MPPDASRGQTASRSPSMHYHQGQQRLQGGYQGGHVYGGAPSEPGMPMNVMAMATSHDMITVSWDAVMDATSYMVERGYMDADNMMMWMTVAEMTTDMMYMDSGLMAETTYYYRVTAMNDAGYGDASDGTAMATTMMMGMPTDGEMLTSPSGVDAASLPRNRNWSQCHGLRVRTPHNIGWCCSPYLATMLRAESKF